MDMLRTTLCIGLLFSWIALKGQQNKVVDKGAKPERVATGFAFTEGPAADGKGNVYFTDQPNNRIHKWVPGEGVSVFMEDAGRSNGLYVGSDGNLYACADAENELWMITPDRQVKVLVSDYEGKKLNGPNDLWITPSGAIYFTDPYYKRSYWSRGGKEIEEERVYYVSPDRKVVRVVLDGFKRPNGIIGTPDGRTLYVADIGDNKTWSFTIRDDGSLTDKKLFAPMGSDGMTIDRKGNVYLTGKGVTIFDPGGQQIGHIPVDEPWTANVCFGGRDMKTLFITASTSVYVIRTKIGGARR